MQAKNKTLMIIALITFLVFTAATIFIFTSGEYAKASQKVAYLHSDLAQFSVKVEESLGYGNSAYRQWKQEVDAAEAALLKLQIPGFICGGLALVSLGGAIAVSVIDKKQQADATDHISA